VPPEPAPAGEAPETPTTTAGAPRLGKRSFLLFVGLGVAALLALGPKLPRDQRLRVRLPGHATVREVRIAWFSTDGDPLREATFTYAPGGAPEALIHELRLPDGDYDVDVEIVTLEGRTVSRKRVTVSGATTTLDVSVRP
jgi:hypothetical protein